MIAAVRRGDQDIDRAAMLLASRIPAPLGLLARVAYNYRWSWLPGGPELFRSVDPHRWELCGEDPVRLLEEASAEALARAAGDDDFLARAASLENTIRADLARPPAPGPLTPERPVAFLCAEYGVHPSLPIYSGGLGALAGDFLKEASDRGLPCVAVGLMYRQGYFRQRLDASGWQHEYWVDTDPERLPAALVRGEDGRPLTVRVPMRGTGVTAQIWRVDVGRTPLFLLDAERPENGRMERWITAQLYAGDPVTRLAQYALLGLGGVRALGRPSASSRRCFTSTRDTPRSPRSRWPWPKGARGVPAATALEAARQRTVFTTHTPVAAGNETYPAEELAHTLGPFAASLGLDPAGLVRLGRSRPDDQGDPSASPSSRCA